MNKPNPTALAERIKPRPLVKSSLHRLGCSVLQRLEGYRGRKFMLFYRPKLSTIIDTEYPNDQKFILRRSIGLVVCQIFENKDCLEKTVLAAFDLANEVEDPVATSQILDKSGIKYKAVDPNAIDDMVGTVFDEIFTSPGSRSTNENRQLMRAEEIVYFRLRDRLTPLGFSYFPEVSLTDALFLPKQEKMTIHERVNEHNKMHPESGVSWNLADTLNFDGVVATAPPYAMPLFFIELDGGSHGHPDKESNEKRRHDKIRTEFKDKVKNRICHNSEVPLLRVAVTNNRFEDEPILKFLAKLAEMLSKTTREEEAHIGRLMDALSKEIEILERDTSSDVKQLVAHVRGYYENKLAVLAEKLEHQSKTIAQQEKEIDLHQPFYEGQDEAYEKMRRDMDAADACRHLKTKPEMFYHISVEMEAREKAAVMCVKCQPSRERKTEFNLPETVLMQEPRKISVYGSKFYKDLVYTEYKRHLHDINREKAIRWIHDEITPNAERYIEHHEAWMRQEKTRELERERQNLLERLERQTTPEDQLGILKKFIGIKTPYFRLGGKTTELARRREAESAQLKLKGALEILENVKGLDADIKKIIRTDLCEYAEICIAKLVAAT